MTESFDRMPLRIALDLGSDSTVAFAMKPRGTKPIQIDLQYFAKALTASPLLLQERDRPSLRIRSRYGALEPVTLFQDPVDRPHKDYDLVERLPESHALQHIVDVDGFVDELSKGESTGLTSFGDTDECLIAFFDSATAPFTPAQLLPNSKLAFQSGLRARTQFSGVVLDPITGDEKKVSFVVSPTELIANQVCLILENFVRRNPALRDENGLSPVWEDCEVVLTVPNTYSPLHRQVLQDTVHAKLKCPVVTVTESDAIVHHYIRSEKPNEGAEMADIRGIRQHYLSIDVGKGTTDLTLMAVWWQIPDDRSRTRYGIPAEDKNEREHTFVLARTGRPSGGAKVTFITVEYLERILDVAIAETFAGLDRSPVRLTRKTGDPEVSETRGDYTNFLSATEAIAEAHKARLILLDGKLTLATLGDAFRPHASTISEFMGHKAPGVGPAVADALLDPMGTWRDTLPDEAKAKLTAADARFKKDIEEYVHENTEQVLIEIAKAHMSDDDYPNLKNGLQALRSLRGEGRSSGVVPETLRELDARMHVILAGQGSRFQPLRAKIKELFTKAGYTVILRNDGPSPIPAATATGGSLVGRLMSRITKQGEQAATAKMPSPIATNRTVLVELDSENLKDGCAQGALRWLRSRPILCSPHHELGQIEVVLSGGEEPKSIPMDDLNQRGEYVVEDGVYTDREIYYYPSRGPRPGTAADRRKFGTLIAAPDACPSVTIRLNRSAVGGGRLEVIANNMRWPLEDNLFGATNLEQLYPMLWPAVLREPE